MEEKEQNKKLDKQKLLAGVFIFKYIKPYLAYFILGMVLLIFGSIIFMVFPGLAGEMANIAIGKDKYKLGLTLNDFGLIFLVVLIVQGVFSYLRTTSFAVVSENGMADLRKDLYDKIITQNLQFYEERRVGELSSRLTADVEQLQNAFAFTLAEFLRQVVVIIVGVIVIAVMTPKLSLLMLATFPVIVISAVLFGRYIRKLSKERQDQLAHSNTIVDETLQSFSVMKSFANEWYESMRYSKSVKDIVKVSMKYAKIRGVFFIFIITVLFGAMFFILWRGAIMVSEHKMEVGDLFSFIIYTGIIGGAIASFGNLYTQIVGALGATERVQEILQRDSEVNIEDGKTTVSKHFNGDIEYRDVHFSYPSRKDIEVLKGININAKKGEKIALIGTSGSGKSTIIQLLMRFYTTDDGKILIDGKEITDYNITSLRQNIGIVPQEVILFGGSIRENILYGKPNAAEEEIIAAAQKSNSWEFISSFPEGLDTIVGERGIKLSGGQRQRIAIARAILKNPSILILDEATSSLDAESEKVVQEALENLMQNRTSIIIAHRLATVRDVDKIYVLENGKIVEEGSHEELYNKENGVYQALAKLQFEV